MTSTILERLEQLVREAGSARELSRRAGLDQKHVGVVLHRLRKNPRAQVERDTAVALARAGSKSLDWLLTGGEADTGSTQETSDAQVVSIDRAQTPRLGQLTAWRQLVAGARAIDPSVPSWTYEYLAGKHADLTKEPTPRLVLGLARLILEEVPAPAGWRPEVDKGR